MPVSMGVSPQPMAVSSTTMLSPQTFTPQSSPSS
jgi:hypothetical protein